MATKDYEEQLFESMKVIAEKCIKAINYDATKQAEIVDDTGKAQGWYQVKIDGTVTCKAHPIDKDTEYKTGDKVVILIPNNDINEQKIILSKWADESTEAYVYESPMESMIDVTGNVIDKTIELSTGGLVANDCRNNDLTLFEDEREDLNDNQGIPGSWRHIGTIKNDNFPLIGYSILGLKANFRTLLSQCVEGDYGLRLRLLCAPPQEIAQYNNALDVFERLKTACLRFVNLYMKANKNGGKTDTNLSNNNVAIKAYQLFNRITANDDSNLNLSNKLYIDIYQAYLEIVKLFTEFEQSVDWKRSVQDGGFIETTDVERTMIHYLHLSQGDNVYSAWLQEMLYDLEQQDLVLTHTRYYTSAAVTADWDNIYTEIKAKASEASRDNLEFAWLTCYNWILETCSDYIDLTKNWQTDTSYYKDNLAPLTTVDFNQCAHISQLTTYLLQNNKYTKITSASGLIAIDSASVSMNNLLKNIMEVSVYLTPKEMIGAIYNCPDGYVQEAIFPIENLGAIYSIDIDLYERPGSFYYFNDDGGLTPYPYLYNDAGELNASAIQDILIEDAWGSAIDPGYTSTVEEDTQQRVADNIFVNDIYICAGYKKDYYNEEQAILYTKQSNTYSPDTVTAKEVSVRWVHKNEETGRFNIVTLQDFDTTKYRIQWYQTDYMSVGDQWSGSQWRQLSQYDNSFYCSFTPRANNYQKELIRCIILAGSLDNNDTFVPAEIVVKSNILTFENEVDLVQLKLEEINLTEGLNIICEDGSNGVYFVYDEMFKTVNKALHTQQKLSLIINNQAIDTAVDINKLSKIAAVNSIEWIIPVNNSMIKFYWDNGLINKDFVLNNEYYESQQLLSEGTSNNNNQRVDKIKIISKQAITGEDNLYKLSYKILDTYDPSKTDNTIICTVKLPNDKYTMATKLSFTFGLASTNGYSYSLVAQCTSDDNPVLYEGTVENRKLTYSIKCYDLNNGMVEVPGTITCTLNETNLIVDNGTVSIANTNIDITTFYILYITYSFNDITLTKTIPIPVEKEDNNHYNDYINNTAPYIYYNADGSLSMTSGLKFNCSKQFNNNYGFLLFKNSANCGYTDNKFIGKMQNNIFAPVSQYYDNVEQFGVVYGLIENNSITSANIVWQCPIIKEQYRYPYASINGWNGMEISIDNSNGNLLAPRLGAGKKNDDNTFSGVILGDWGSTSQIDGISGGMTGIYGFRKGAVTYAFNDDGTAFIGGNDSGRIYFNSAGTGTITSGNYLVNSAGMLINLKDGKIDMINSAGHITIDASDRYHLMTIKSGNKTLLNIGTDSYYLQSANYQENSAGTRINLNDGKLETHDGVFTGTIYATDGYISGNVTVDGTISADNIRAGTISGTNGIKINFTNFSIDNSGNVSVSGYVSATSGYIGGCEIANGVLTITSANISGKLKANQLDLTSVVAKDTNYNGLTIGSASTSISGFIINQNYLYHLYNAQNTAFNNNNVDFFICPIGDTDVNFTIEDLHSGSDWVFLAKNPIAGNTSTGCGITKTGQLYARDVNFLTGDISGCFTFNADGIYGKYNNAYRSLFDYQKLIFADNKAHLYIPATAYDNNVYVAGLYYDLSSHAIRQVGTWYTSGNDAVTSSRAKKSNIQSFTNLQSIFFDNLKPCQFILSNKQHKGFIIDEVYTAAASAHLNPEDCGIYFSNDKKDPYDSDASLCYNDFIALNTWQIQLLKQRVKTLEDKIKELEDKLNEN